MLYFKAVETEEELRESYRLRYRIYCLERKWLHPENYPEKEERDDFDRVSAHFIALDKDRDVVGTIRLILPPGGNPPLPIVRHPNVASGMIDAEKSAEISRLTVIPELRNGDVALGLYRIMYNYSMRVRLRKWYIVVNPGFLYMLNRLRFRFSPLAEGADYFGDETVPAQCDIAGLASYVSTRNPYLFEWFQEDPSRITEKRVLFYLMGRSRKSFDDPR